MSVKFTSKSVDASECASGYLVVGIYDNKDFTTSARQLNDKTKGAISALLENGDLAEKPGSCALIPLVRGIKSKRVIIVRLGARKDFSAKQFNLAMNGVATLLTGLTADSVCIFISDMDIEDRDLSWMSRRVVEVSSQKLYRFDQLKKESKKRRKAWRIQISTEESTGLSLIRTGVRVGKAISEGVSLAKDLGNLPGNICTPSYLAEKAQEIGTNAALEVEILDEDQMEELGMGSLLSVSRGSREPAKLIIMKYQGSSEEDSPIVFVGKGLTFDAGGISIKPAGAMDEMKFDMCGGAGVIGAMLSISQLKLPVNVIGVVASSENLPDGAANKPGDIVKSMSGITIEILNTDAEGRLILCDALTYVRRFNPAVVIDAATLTGACVVALGKHPSGLFCDDPELTEALVRAGTTSEDRVWPMPLWDDYQSQLDSNFADVANIGGRDAGAVTAACFLARFTNKMKWAHLDIAGTAWHSGKAKGSTGRPVNLFVQYVLDRC
ncbi:MAG: leucyl aminopeptidase [Acidiferrobacterales bacterium]|nr:leucyl aminopeptidase [Acidiferrobacterales bacterium]